ncbi:MAG TPA: hypothetical protein VJ505_14815 [Holophagaceae bacterium]|nr:hypothetical protein [Geothrix sp.]HJW34615.1 hypothetical protein [Holophagaceae bacterium]
MNTLLALTLAALLSPALPAQTPPTAPTPQATQPKEPDPDPSMLKTMKSKVFEVKHRSPLWLSNSVRALQSGVRGTFLNWTDNDGLKLISVRDFPENLAAIEEAVKRLDVPSAIQKAMDVDLTLQVLVASKHPVPEGGLPEELQPIIKSLKGALAYRGYTLAASFVQRWDLSSGRMAQGKGQVEGSTLGLGAVQNPSRLLLEWEASPSPNLDQRMSGMPPLQISKFQFVAIEEQSAGPSHNLAKIETSVNLKEGEKVVVGTTVVKDRGLIVVLSARRVN